MKSKLNFTPGPSLDPHIIFISTYISGDTYVKFINDLILCAAKTVLHEVLS